MSGHLVVFVSVCWGFVIIMMVARIGANSDRSVLYKRVKYELNSTSCSLFASGFGQMEEIQCGGKCVKLENSCNFWTQDGGSCVLCLTEHTGTLPQYTGSLAADSEVYVKTDVEWCEVAWCENNGTCVQSEYGFICVCSSIRYSGMYCEIDDAVAMAPSYHHIADSRCYVGLGNIGTFGINTTEDCAAECDSLDECVAFLMKYATNSCTLKPRCMQKDVETEPQYDTYVKKYFQSYYRVVDKICNAGQGNIGVMFTDNPAECASACDEDGSCAGFNYYLDTIKCLLKAECSELGLTTSATTEFYVKSSWTDWP